jgi:hypothetical protein
MKKFIVALLVIVLLLVVVFGIWGYIKAQDIKKQGSEIDQITSGTLALTPVNQNGAEISLSAWKALSDQSTSVLSRLEKLSAAPDSLKNKASQFYSAKAQDKYKEAQYLNALLVGQRGMDLKSSNPKSKGQIETTLKSLDKMQSELNNLAVGPDFNTLLRKAEQESAKFKEESTNISSKMSFESPAVQLSSAGLDKAMDELIQAISKSLNSWVDLQNQIRDEISAMSKANWVNPL